MELHCKSIVGMAGKNSDESAQFSISLPLEAIDEIENGLIPFGLYGKKRATICRALILDMLKQSSVRGHIKEGREKAATPAPKD